jgi:Ni/Co efflux regulator RcnB
MNSFSLLLVLAVAVPAAPLAAQQPDSANSFPRDSAVSRHRHGDHRGHNSGDNNRMGGRRGMPFDPARLLARKDALGLSAQQVAQLTALEDNAKPGMTAALQQIKNERVAIAAGLNAELPTRFN